MSTTAEDQAYDTLDRYLRLKHQSLQTLALSSPVLPAAQRQRLENQVAEYNLILRDTFNRAVDLTAVALEVPIPPARPLEQSDGQVFADMPMELAYKTVQDVRKVLKWQAQIKEVQQRVRRAQDIPWWWPYFLAVLVVVVMAVAIGSVLRFMFVG